MQYHRANSSMPGLAGLASFLACLVLLTFASGASAAMSVTFDQTAGKITATGSAGSLSLSYSGFSYTIQGTAFSTSSPGCNATDTQVTCAAGANAIREIEVQSDASLDSFRADISVPRHVTVRTRGFSNVSSDNAPLEAFMTDAHPAEVLGSPTHDYIVVTAGDDSHTDGQSGDDQIVLSVGPPASGNPLLAHRVSGGAGEDIVDASGSTGVVDYEASPGTDVFIGGSGDDQAHMGNGDDWGFGGPGNDRFYDDGGAGKLKLWGGPGNDHFVESDQAVANLAVFDGGPGMDSVNYVSMDNQPSTKTVTLNDDAANDGAPAVNDFDLIHPSVEEIGNDPAYNADTRNMYGDDTLYGSAGRNVIRGLLGNDTIYGLGGLDTLFGGEGSDSITGGDAKDNMLGGGGDDIIDAADGEADWINCGTGVDIVYADANETFADGSCETVNRQ